MEGIYIHTMSEYARQPFQFYSYHWLLELLYKVNRHVSIIHTCVYIQLLLDCLW